MATRRGDSEGSEGATAARLLCSLPRTSRGVDGGGGRPAGGGNSGGSQRSVRARNSAGDGAGVCADSGRVRANRGPGMRAARRVLPRPGPFAPCAGTAGVFGPPCCCEPSTGEPAARRSHLSATRENLFRWRSSARADPRSLHSTSPGAAGSRGPHGGPSSTVVKRERFVGGTGCGGAFSATWTGGGAGAGVWHHPRRLEARRGAVAGHPPDLPLCHQFVLIRVRILRPRA